MDRVEDALPQLLTSYRAGVLVPFIGSGMSVPALRSWGQFVLALARAAGYAMEPQMVAAIEANQPVVSTKLYRLADVCVRLLRAQGTLAPAVRGALGMVPGRPAEIPDQTTALAAIDWPLVLSTNYDDLLLRAEAETQRLRGLRGRFELAGQSPRDCHAVLRSLDVVAPPMVWALQGYLGDGALTATPLSAGRVAHLERELVIGHQQYQTVINAKPHLRRAVAEVFRRRSLLFLGSGVQEDYLVNLFGEIIHHHGASAHRHFAVFHEDQRGDIDSDFFRLRLGIQPLFIARYQDIAGFLRQLAANLGRAPPPPQQRIFGCALHELAFRFPGDARGAGSGLTLRLRHGPLEPMRDQRACVGVSVGRGRRGPYAGEMTTSFAKVAGFAAGPRDWVALDAQRYLFAHRSAAGIFAIAPRDRDDDDSDDGDSRDLTVIPKALRAFLDHVDTQFETASVGLLAAGPSWRRWPPLFPFVMMLFAVRTFAASRRHLRELTIAIVDPAVWAPLAAGKIPIASLLSTDLATVWVHVIGAAAGDDEIETYTLTIQGTTTLPVVARQCGLQRGRWQVTVFPRPEGDQIAVADWRQVLVVPGATVTLRLAQQGEADVLDLDVPAQVRGAPTVA